ncbi:MAG: hypothetical protein MJ016_05105 [Victivallaceae bacterium]|nr:hypothetical protein [Victivallaceae bacterium]
MICGEDFRLEVRSAGKKYLSLEIDGIERLAVGRVRFGKFSEIGALGKKFRVHHGDDRFVCGIDSECVVPFGCEYAVARSLEIGDGALIFSTDVSALHFGRVGDVELEELFFPGAVEKVSLWAEGETHPRVFTAPGAEELYRGEAYPLRLRVDFPDGAAVEYQPGFDLWRHAAAERIDGATAHYALVSAPDGLRLVREVLHYAEDVESEKRPWRFHQLLSWKTARREKSAPAAPPETIAGCPLSGAWRREFRRRVRRCSGSFVLGGATASVCTDPSHLDRAGRGELPHSPMQEYLASYFWANRLLKKHGGSFAVVPAENDGALLWDVLQCIPREIGDGNEAEI